MPRKCISAYTAPGAEYPAYFSLNEEEPGRSTLAVRTQGHNGLQTATIDDLDDAALKKLADDIYAHLADRRRGR